MTGCYIILSIVTLRMLIAALIVLMGGCSKDNKTKQPVLPPVQENPNSAQPAAGVKNPLYKFIELVGFRTSEEKPGAVKVRFGVVNHSEAEVGDLGLRITLKPSLAKPSDPGICTFDVKVLSLKPNELKDVEGTCQTKLRIYELPDWQFLRATFEITSPEN